LGDDLKSSQQVAALNSIDLEHENYRAAWNWATSQGTATQLTPSLDALCLYYDLSLRYADGESACRAAIEGLSQGQDDVDLWLIKARVFTWQSRFTRLLGQPELASQLLDNALAHLKRVKVGENMTSSAEAFLALEQGNNHFHSDRSAATACYRKSLQIYRSIDDTWGTAKVLSRLGFVAHHAGNFQEAVEIYSECLDLNRKLGDLRGIANALIGSGQNSLRQGMITKGEQNITEGVTVLQQIGDRAGVARGYFELGRYYYWSGEFNNACRYNDDALPIFEDLGMLDQYIFSSIAVGLALSQLGKYIETITRVIDSIHLAQELDTRREIGLAHVILGMAYLGQGDLEQAEKSASKSVEQYRDLNQQDELSFALAIMVYTQLGLGQSHQAKLYLCEILQIGISISGVYPILYILLAASLILIESGDTEKGLEISALAERYPFVGNSRWFEDIAGREIAEAADSLSPEVVTAAEERGKKRDIWETAKELLEELSEKVS
jgi:tetratricopeptide (TPR) repeat protein